MFLGALACVGTGTIVGKTQFDRPDTVRIRYWLSEKAAEYDIHHPIKEYVGEAFAPMFESVDVTYGGALAVTTEHGYHVSKVGEWPLNLLRSESKGLDTVRDANILITDGPLGPDPLGIARFTFASLGGARHIENAPDRDDIEDVVEFDSSLFVLQVLLHEIGHTLGLHHEHGTIDRVSDGIVASPMVSAYAWLEPSEQFNANQSVCHQQYPQDREGNRYLSFEFADCARREINRSRRWFG